MASIEDLTALVPPPPAFGHAIRDWEAIDSDLGFVTPRDYRAIVDAYGAGVFGGFLWLMLPESNAKRLNMQAEITAQRHVLRELAEFEEVPYEIESLIPCGATNNGDTFFWRTNGFSASAQWTIVVNSGRDPQWDEYQGNLLDFLVDVFSNRYKCQVFPEDFPAEGDRNFAPLRQLSN
ncbi:hypothetical protein P3F83_08065 [Mycobacteroides immunogenum]|uniref:hypothetical protein n=1 Tax=Mycobacteroides immunogenum TaxID=83262 RepID=UPI0025B7A1C3|nr:hypothetical protein [Mycobacteroides immunogenum]WJR35312.1 hypothetical protein P3F83_08065 [Mycobacteroides immunogenum]